MKKKDNRIKEASFAITLFFVLSLIFLIVGVLSLIIGFLATVGANFLLDLLPSSITHSLLPKDVLFMGPLMIVAGISLIIFSRITRAARKWLGERKVNGIVLGILLSAIFTFFLVFVSIYVPSVNVGSAILYILIILFVLAIISMLSQTRPLEGGVVDAVYGIVPLLIGVVIIAVMFSILYTVFPQQTGSFSSLAFSPLSYFIASSSVSTFNSSSISYAYPSYFININLNNITSSFSSYIGLGNKSANISKGSNLSLDLLLPSQFIISTIESIPSINFKNVNITNLTDAYLSKKNASAARSYLINRFPPLAYFSVIAVGSQKINSSVSLFNETPSEAIRYLTSLNITAVNSSFPINVTKYVISQTESNASQRSLLPYLPSEFFLVNMSNHVGLEMVYNQSRIFKLTHIPFYSVIASVYSYNSTFCFEVGTVLTKSDFPDFYSGFKNVEQTLKCS